MTLISGPLSTVTTTPSAVSQVNISINSPRTWGAGVMTPEVKTVTVTGGDFSSQIAPGPAVLTLLIGGRESAPIPILVDDVESQTLAEVVDDAQLATGYSAENLAQFVQQVLGARHDVLDAVAEFEQLEGDVRTAMGETATSAASAAASASNAETAAVTAGQAAVSAESKFDSYTSRVVALEALGGLSAESPVDGQTANLVLQGDSLTRASISGLFAEDPPGSGLFTIPGGM